MIKNCIECGKEYKPRKERETTSKWCGNECASVGKSKIFTGNELRKGITPTNAFKHGERLGEDHPRWQERQKFTCKFCGSFFEKEKWRVNQKDHTNDFCSIGCRGKYKSEFLSGENAPDWVGGAKTYRGKSFTTARKQVLELQKGVCATCGTYKGSRLAVHHIRPFRDFVSAEESNQLHNLIGLCQSCHMQMEDNQRKGLPLMPAWLLRNSMMLA